MWKLRKSKAPSTPRRHSTFLAYLSLLSVVTAHGPIFSSVALAQAAGHVPEEGAIGILIVESRLVADLGRGDELQRGGRAEHHGERPAIGAGVPGQVLPGLHREVVEYDADIGRVARGPPRTVDLLPVHSVASGWEWRGEAGVVAGVTIERVIVADRQADRRVEGGLELDRMAAQVHEFAKEWLLGRGGVGPAGPRRECGRE
jgi:hypothetical protein